MTATTTDSGLASPALAPMEVAQLRTWLCAAIAAESAADEHIDDAGMRASEPAFAAAAVLVPFECAPEPTILLTRRTQHLRHHPGQVSFPGGRVEAGDVDAIETALREAREEIGLAYEQVDVIGTMQRYDSRTGFSIVPVVAIVRPGAPLRLARGEVEAVLRLPLEFLLDTRNHGARTAPANPQQRVHTMTYAGEEIWGVTAGILMRLYNRLAARPELLQSMPNLR